MIVSCWRYKRGHFPYELCPDGQFTIFVTTPTNFDARWDTSIFICWTLLADLHVFAQERHSDWCITGNVQTTVLVTMSSCGIHAGVFCMMPVDLTSSVLFLRFFINTNFKFDA